MSSDRKEIRQETARRVLKRLTRELERAHLVLDDWDQDRVVTKVSLLDGMNLPDGPDVRCCPLADMRCSPLSMLEQTSCPAPKSGVLFVARVCNFGRLVAL